MKRDGPSARVVPHQDRDDNAPVGLCGATGYATILGLLFEVFMLDIYPIVNKIGDLKGRVASLRGYL